MNFTSEAELYLVLNNEFSFRRRKRNHNSTPPSCVFLTFNLKAQNILIFTFGVNEYHFISLCKTSKEMWDALETVHEGTDEGKQ